MKISIITICKDNPEELYFTLSSFYNELSSDVESIIVDGSKYEDCFDIASDFEKVSYHKQSSIGIYGAMNEGVRLSNGETIVFMNSGDTFDSSFDINIFVKKFRDNLSEKIIFGDSVQFYHSYLKKNNFPNFLHNKKDFWKNKLPSHQSVFCPKTILLAFPFDETKKISADTKFLIHAFQNNEYIYYPKLISRFKLGGISNCPNSIANAYIHCKEIIEVREISSSTEIIKLFIKQFSKVIAIKIMGYLNYLKLISFVKRIGFK